MDIVNALGGPLAIQMYMGWHLFALLIIAVCQAGNLMNKLHKKSKEK